MLPIKPVCLALALFSLNSIACSGVPSASFYYQPWGQGTKYIVEDSDGYGLYFSGYSFTAGEVQTTAPCI